jgi:hypothetical protein
MRNPIVWLFVLVSMGVGQNWELKSVLPEIGSAFDADVATDSLCLPHLAFVHAGHGLAYASWSDDSWSIEYPDTSDRYLGLDFTLDQDDAPHIGYALSHWPEPSEVRYAYRSGDTWRVETAVAGCTPRSLTFGALALARDKTPHIVFVDSAAVAYAYRTADTWNVLAVPAYQTDPLRWLISASLALDTSDQPGIAVSWWKAQGGSRDSMWLSFFEHDSTGWHRSDVDSTELAAPSLQAWPPRVRNDPATDLFHVVYREGAYATGKDGNWVVEEAAVPPCGYACDFVLHHGQPHVISGGVVPPQYTWRTAEGWETEFVVETTSTVAGAPSIAVDRTGRPHAAFVSANDESLYYARRLFAGTEEPAPAIVRPKLGLQVNPNPAPHAFTLEFPVRSPSTATIRLCDALGGTVWSQEEKVIAGQYRQRLSLSASIRPGVYFIEVATPTERSRKKVVLTK